MSVRFPRFTSLENANLLGVSSTALFTLFSGNTAQKNSKVMVTMDRLNAIYINKVIPFDFHPTQTESEKMKKIVVIILSLSALCAAQFASADYICNVTYWPSQGTLGASGYVRASFYTAPSCTGTSRGYFYLCSENSTASQCASSTRYEYSLEVLLAHFRAMQDAAINGEYVLRNVTTDCNGNTGEFCLINVQYY